MREGASRAALSLGSNLGDREANLARARSELAAFGALPRVGATPGPGGTGFEAPRRAADGGAPDDGRGEDAAGAIELVAASEPRDTAPQGFSAQPDFLNQVLLVRTELSPWQLLEACLEIERRLGRVRGPVRWGPRSIDLDILAYDGLVVRDARLTIPHAALPLRPFFLEMMREIGADELLP